MLGQWSNEPGRWRNSRTPYLKGPMDAWTDPEVEWIIVMSGSQIGKTEFMLNVLGYVLDEDPGTALLVLPDEKTAQKVVRGRLHSLCRDTPSLSQRILGSPDSLGLVELHFDRMVLYPAWANSPAALSSIPCRYVLMDEVGKFPPFSGREASPVANASKRTRTFRNRRRIALTSTPSRDNDLIVQEYNRSNQQSYHIPCPHCGRYQILKFEQLKWPKGADADEVYDEDLAWYECESCKLKLRDAEKAWGIARGRWVPKACTITDAGEVKGKLPSRRRSGFHIPGLLSPWTRFREFAAEYIEIAGDVGRRMAFQNSELGLPWTDKHSDVSIDRLKACERDYQPRVVPAWTRLLTLGVDVQADHFWFVVRAWGLAAKSALIDHGRLDSPHGSGFEATWAPVQSLIDGAYPREDNKEPVPIGRAHVDSAYHAQEVYAFAQKNAGRNVWAVHGAGHGRMLSPMQPSQKVPRLLMAQTLRWKDTLMRHIESEPEAPGEWTIYRVDDGYVRQMTSERRVHRQGGYPRWEPIKEGAPCHLWDAEVLALSAAHCEGIHYLQAETERKYIRRPRKQFKTPDGRPFLITER